MVTLLYQDLRRIAAGLLHPQREQAKLQPTELVNESFLRMFGMSQIQWQDRSHFLAIAAHVMRQVLVDQFRKANAIKRAHQDVTLTNVHLVGREQDMTVESVDEALTRLAMVSKDLVNIVEMKFFVGMTNKEISCALEVSESTVKRNWRTARAWLLTDMQNQQ